MGECSRATSPSQCRFMMRLLYCLLTAVAAPAVFAATLMRGTKDPAYRAHLTERFGWGGACRGPSIWLHAVSLGEVPPPRRWCGALRARHPGVPLVLSTATPTGRAQAVALFGPDIEVRFCLTTRRARCGDSWHASVRARRSSWRRSCGPTCCMSCGGGACPSCSQARGSQRDRCRVIAVLRRCSAPAVR